MNGEKDPGSDVNPGKIPHDGEIHFLVFCENRECVFAEVSTFFHWETFGSLKPAEHGECSSLCLPCLVVVEDITFSGFLSLSVPHASTITQETMDPVSVFFPVQKCFPNQIEG